jgi:osmotically-inducible protein OsmY
VTADNERPLLPRTARASRLLTHRTAKIAALCAFLGGGVAWWALGASPHLAKGAVADPLTAADRPEPQGTAEDPESVPNGPRSASDAAADPELGALVRKRLQWDTAVGQTQVQVQVDDARVALVGTVGSARQRQRAIEAAWIAGVRDVDATALIVAGARRGAVRLPAPATIERAIMAALAVDPSVKGADLRVTVRGGVAMLRGKVDNLAAARAAELVAEHTFGIAAVANEIAVSPWGDDDAIAADVAAALRANPETAAFGVDARSDDGTVTLEGEVAGFGQRTAAEDVAARIHGVQGIDNRLRVRAGEVAFYYDPHPSLRPVPEPGPAAEGGAVRDEDIAGAIRAELQWSRFLGGAQIDVSVRRGTATLTGDVATTAIHDVVLWNAYQGGAKAVVDRLFVAEQPLAGTAPQTDPGDVVFGRD